MDTALFVLLGVTLAVWLSVARPRLGVDPAPVDRDKERQAAELRAMSNDRL
ncbi:MAG: hypothetical protein ACRD0H_30720 [Actinomycetes bacterium]